MANNYSLVIEVKNLNLKDLNELYKRVYEWEQNTITDKNTRIDIVHTDPVGGKHFDGCGSSPYGDICGECDYITCEDCGAYARLKEKHSKKKG